MNIDPVCSMAIDDINAQYKARYRGKDYWFCSNDCKTKFESNSQGYVEAQRKQVPTNRKVVVVGAGQVGSTICFALMTSGLAS